MLSMPSDGWFGPTASHLPASKLDARRRMDTLGRLRNLCPTIRCLFVRAVQMPPRVGRQVGAFVFAFGAL